MSHRALLGLGLLVGVAACEVPLDPIAASDLVYTLSGYLDASAETQTLRVEPLAPTALGDPGPIDAEVSLTDLATGATVALAQEVRAFPTGPAHLFTTDAPIARGARYRVVARRADGAEASTEVEIPAPGSYTVEVSTGRQTCPTTVVVSGAERVVEVQARYVLVQDGQLVERRYSHADSFERRDDGALVARIYYADDAREMGLDPLRLDRVVSADVVVAVSTSAWPDPLVFSLEEALQTQTGAVTNGLGFVGGAVTERRPFVPGVIVFGFGPTAQTLPCTAG